jgi:SAM-dependent methyltransferase
MNDRDTTVARRSILAQKSLMRAVYSRWYSEVMSGANGVVVEIGSGAGFIQEHYPHVITSDVLDLPFVDKVFDALSLPFESATVDRFVMIDVFHHVADSARFLREMCRCLKVGGVIAMVEPAHTFWARLVWTCLHHEPYDPHAGWIMPAGSPLSCANSAQPWIVFNRDRKKFQKMFPDLAIERMQTHTPIAYIASGGFSMRQLVPDSLISPIMAIDRFFSFQGLNVTILLRKTLT